MLYGLTGGIASGKSFVARCFVECGARVLSADDWARAAVTPGSVGLHRLIDRFGRDYLTHEGGLDRQALAARIFRHPEERKALEEILHPLIYGIGRREIDDARTSEPNRLLIAEIPLLFETGRDWSLDGTILVYVPPEVQLARLIARDRLDRESARRRLAAQLPIDDKKARADHLIDNSGERSATELQVRELYLRLTR